MVQVIKTSLLSAQVRADVRRLPTPSQAISSFLTWRWKVKLRPWGKEVRELYPFRTGNIWLWTDCSGEVISQVPLSWDSPSGPGSFLCHIQWRYSILSPKEMEAWWSLSESTLLIRESGSQFSQLVKSDRVIALLEASIILLERISQTVSEISYSLKRHDIGKIVFHSCSYSGIPCRRLLFSAQDHEANAIR